MQNNSEGAAHVDLEAEDLPKPVEEAVVGSDRVGNMMRAMIDRKGEMSGAQNGGTSGMHITLFSGLINLKVKLQLTSELAMKQINKR